MRLTVLATLSALTLAACAAPADQGQSLAPAESATGTKTYGDRPFWDGDVCVEILPSGKRTIVNKASCPPKS